MGSVGIFTTDLALVVQSWDAWLAEASGVAEADARGRPLAELFPELQTRGLLTRLQRVGESGRVEVLAPAFHEYLIPCAPRLRPPQPARMQLGHMHQHVTIAPLRDDDAIVGIMVTIEDVTARRVHERELALQLQSTDEAVRLHAVRALAANDGPVDGLSGALGDQSWRVRRAAADGLAHSHDDHAIEALLAAVRDRHRDPAVLNAALTALVQSERDVLPALLPLLELPDADVRTYTALALGLLEDPRAVPALVHALADADDNVRFHALEALGRVRAREAALPVLALAESRDFAVAFAALDTLALIGEPSVAPRLVPLLDDPLLLVAAVEALGRLGSEDAVAPLALLLQQPGAPVASIAGALVALHDRYDDDARDLAEGSERSGSATAPTRTNAIAELARAVIGARGSAAVIDALDHASDAELPELVVVLGWLPDVEQVVAPLTRLLVQPAVRSMVADILAAGGSRAAEALIEVLGAEDDDDVRKAAAATLGRIGTPSAVPALIELLCAAPTIAVVAAGALGAIGDHQAFAPLIAQLDHPNASVRQACVAALSSIGHPELPDRLISLLQHSSPRVREGAVRLAGYLGLEPLLDNVLLLCRDTDDTVRRSAVDQLPHFSDPRACAAIREALETDVPGVRAAAAQALTHVEQDEALPLLRRAAGDRDPWVRYYAARSMGHHRQGQVVPTLTTLALADPVPPVRIAAVDALAEIGDPDGIAALLPLVSDPDSAVACPAMVALGRGANRQRLVTGSLDAALQLQLASDEPRRRGAALAAIASRGDASALAAVVSLAHTDADPELRRQAMDTVGCIGGAEAIAALIAMAEDPRAGADVIGVLVRAGAGQLPWVARGLEHPGVGVRCTVVEALGRTRATEATALLSQALRDDEPAVRHAAAYALARHDLRATAAF